ncbi:MAG: hypothetical protein JNL97_05705 [Verrucomicrobiales bacterium]|nr:hypothetical protein [Verrucomicrobiales bacterium]
MLLRLATIGLLALARLGPSAFAESLRLGNQLELFVDRHLVDRLEGGASLRLHTPQRAEVALRFDRPWEGPFSAYVTVLHDTRDARYRMYYRGMPVVGADGSTNEVTCYAESRDGIAWTKPDLGLHDVRGTRSNNVVLAHRAPFSHNFAPFLDARPGIPDDERFKALAGTSASGLHGFASADGIHWRRWSDRPLITQGAFDSQNVAFWSTSEDRYVLYFRTWSRGEFEGFRTISRSTSTNFADWTPPTPMTFGDTPLEHLYTSQTHPYFRAPHVYIATPMRFMPGRRVLSPEQARTLGVDPGYAGDVAETVFMTSRGGTVYERTFMEGFIRPGPDLGNWASRAGLSALGIVPTGPAEMSLYKQAHYAQPDGHLVRYTLRTDGFVSVHGDFVGGTLITKPFTTNGRNLVVNLATGAAGSLRVEVLREDGTPIPGFAGDDVIEQVGDEIERRVRWRSGRTFADLLGMSFRLRIALKDADLYSLRFD